MLPEIEKLRPDNRSATGLLNFKDVIKAICARTEITSVLEIGGGRSPLLSADNIEQFSLKYTVNDISNHELQKCPDHVETLCFDIAGTAPAQQFDLVFSNMVIEHVRDTRKAYENIHGLLAPGGLCLNFHPTLFALPFLINQLLPNSLTALILRWRFPERNEDEIPKFPANYSWCFASNFQEERIRKIGFQDACITPFYGHGYFSSIPIIRSLDNSLSDWARRHDIRFLASYAYTVAVK